MSTGTIVDGVRTARVGAAFDFAVDLADYLEEYADTLSIVPTPTVAPTGSVVIDNTEIIGTKVHVWLSGFVAGELYIIRIPITTDGGRTDVRTVAVRAIE